MARSAALNFGQSEMLVFHDYGAEFSLIRNFWILSNAQQAREAPKVNGRPKGHASRMKFRSERQAVFLLF